MTTQSQMQKHILLKLVFWWAFLHNVVWESKNKSPKSSIYKDLTTLNRMWGTRKWIIRCFWITKCILHMDIHRSKGLTKGKSHFLGALRSHQKLCKFYTTASHSNMTATCEIENTNKDLGECLVFRGVEITRY